MRYRRLLLCLISLVAVLAQAQTALEVGSCPFDQPLVEPPVLMASGGKLETTFTVRMSEVEVPNWINVAPFGEPPVFQCTMTKMTLRGYSWPAPGGEASGFPGPTLKLRKAASRQSTGDALAIRLVNELPVGPNDTCNEGCDCSDPDRQPQCCKATDVFPACFHGNNNTNLHFHGTHVSPQPPQDFVLLELRPKGATMDSHGTHEHGTVAMGTYDYRVDPFRYTQPEGTHWYHPHKHGSTAIQVGNGLAGAIIIEGKFDDDLRALYGGALEEHVMVLQLIQELNFTRANAGVPQPLINGQPSPVIDMYPGEIRRLRLVAATVQSDGRVTIDFDGPGDDGPEVMQISMDGVQFAPENYARQPLITASSLELAPGNRADVLLKAPATPGTYDVTYELLAPEMTLDEGEGVVRSLAQQIAANDAEPRLFRIRVSSCIADAPCPQMSFPEAADFPKLPDFLADIPEELVEVRRNLFFELEDAQGTVPPDRIPGQPSKFFINLRIGEKRQFDPSCIDITARLGQTQQWTLWNTSKREPISPLHVFHIHTNAFQVIHHPLKPKMNTPPYVWMDSILLLDATQGAIEIRHTFNEFTGAYVLHCHFLGHEDRGMMLGVQVVCPDGASKFGSPRLGAAADDCRPVAQIDSLPECTGKTPVRRRAVHRH